MAANGSITRVILQNYKSIRHCDVALAPLTFFVGPNGAGKSNFVEALRFLSYGLSNSLELAVANRSGAQSILHRGHGHSPLISFRLDFDLSNSVSGLYKVEIAVPAEGPVVVIREDCSVESPTGRDWFIVNRAIVESNQGIMPAASEEKLYLVNASGLPAFEPVYRALSAMAVYNPVTDEIKGFHAEKRYRVLDRNGSALAETVAQLKVFAPERLARVTEYLRKINPDVLAFEPVELDANFNLRFELRGGESLTHLFMTQNISDGTLRALAILVALFQKTDRYPVDVIALEEPESGLHPAAAGVLFDSLIEASRFRQVIVTSHSPDLLDREDIPEDSLKAVIMSGGRTLIGSVDEVGKRAMRERLYTAGELMRMDQLRPEGAADDAGV
jgi:predicted ATPase